MTYAQFIMQAKDMCLAIDDDNNTCYLLPDYRYLLSLANMKLEEIEDFPEVTWDIVSENLKLEAEAYNATNNYVPYIAAAIKDIMVTQLSTLAVQEQNELFTHVIEYMKAKNKEENPNPSSDFSSYIFAKKDL